jgi:hypothetical protein
MKQLIEYKLWAGQIPYFVEDPLGGVYSDCGCKRYGISKDTDECYLPDTVRTLTVGELEEIVQQADLVKADSGGGVVQMTGGEKQEYLEDWLAKNGVGDEIPMISVAGETS